VTSRLAWPVRLALLAITVNLTIGCTKSATERPPGPVVCALIALDAELGADTEGTTAAFSTLQDIAKRVERRHRSTHADPVEDMGAVVFGELGFEREIERADTRFFRLSSVLRDRRGSCLGLGALYLAIGERLGVPLDGILLPGHFFVRTRGAGAHNVELLRRGETMPDQWYRQKYGPWPHAGSGGDPGDGSSDGSRVGSRVGSDDSAYFRPVSPGELTAIHWYNRGNDLRRSGDLAAAETAFARAAQGFPTFAEAHASLGAAQQLRGDFVSAASSYRRAARAWPDLPGLAGNLELLQRQLAPAPDQDVVHLPSAGSAFRQK
jgi:tetratricopeptide (TPR) repeat protein